MWAAFVYDELRRQGDLVLPVGRVHLGEGLSTWPALVIGVATAALLGLILHLVVFRPLRSAPPLAKVVASVGVAITLEALVVLRFGTGRRAVPPTLPERPGATSGRSASPQDRIWFAALVVAIAVGALGVRSLHPRRACHAGRRRERARRHPPRLLTRPAGRRHLGARRRSSAAPSPMLVSPTVGLEPVTWTLMVVPGLACALVGRLTSVGVACAAGLALGAVESEITLLSAHDWWPDWATVGVAQTVPLLVIVVALFLLGRHLPARGSATRRPAAAGRHATACDPRRRRCSSRPAWPPCCSPSGSYRFGVITSMIAALIALSLVVLDRARRADLAGAGRLRRRRPGFALSKIGTGLPFPISLLAAALAATALGPVGRRSRPAGPGRPAGGGHPRGRASPSSSSSSEPEAVADDRQPHPRPRSSSASTSPCARGPTIARWQFGILVLVVLALAALAVANLGRSGTGRALLAVRSNERAAASLGVDVAAAKLIAFGMSSFLAGLGGALIGYSRGQLSADVVRRLGEPDPAGVRLPRRGSPASAAPSSPAPSPRWASATSCSTAPLDLGEHYLLVSGRAARRHRRPQPGVASPDGVRAWRRPCAPPGRRGAAARSDRRRGRAAAVTVGAPHDTRRPAARQCGRLRPRRDRSPADHDPGGPQAPRPRPAGAS